MKIRPTHNPQSNLPFDTDQVREQDRHWIHPWENFKTAGAVQRTIIAHSEGIYLTDTEGNRFCVIDTGRS